MGFGNYRRLSAEDYHSMADKKDFLISWVGDSVPRNNNKNTKWTCQCGEVFEYSYGGMNRKTSGCRKCRYKKGASKKRNGPDKYHELAKKTNGVKRWIGPEVSNVTTEKTKWEFDCGHTHEATYLNVSHGHGCPICSSSKGEEAVVRFLNSHNVNFERQKRFSDCRNKRQLPFDFYLPDYGLLIEYNGIQHYHVSSQFFSSDKRKFKKTQTNDKIKREWAEKKDGIRLIVIPYQQINNIDTILFSAIS